MLNKEISWGALPVGIAVAAGLYALGEYAGYVILFATPFIGLRIIKEMEEAKKEAVRVHAEKRKILEDKFGKEELLLLEEYYEKGHKKGYDRGFSDGHVSGWDISR